jgi:hypothetical protein
MHYQKLSIPIDAQIQQLKSRGLLIAVASLAEHYPACVGKCKISNCIHLTKQEIRR